jgi:exopolyphosphatase/guanosine-5'-triphosphate,3'-diphosphate pyrophosphatase
MLEIGAILHDCGITIDYRSHHRHGHDMVLHAELPTLTRREREIIALLARYHRKRGPNSTNHAFKQLSAGDQRLVAHLAGILRIADGLDRCHDQQVLQVQAQRKKDRIVIRAHAHHEPTVGMLAARKKGDLFRRAFRIPVELEWVPTRTPVATDTAQENRRE